MKSNILKDNEIESSLNITKDMPNEVVLQLVNDIIKILNPPLYKEITKWLKDCISYKHEERLQGELSLAYIKQLNNISVDSSLEEINEDLITAIKTKEEE